MERQRIIIFSSSFGAGVMLQDLLREEQHKPCCSVKLLSVYFFPILF